MAAASANNKVAACAHVVRSGERGTEAAPETSGTLEEMAANQRGDETERLKSCLYVYIVQLYSHLEGSMPKDTKVVRKNMRLRQDLIDRARRVLGTKTETETVEQALELVTFRKDVAEGIRRIAGSGSLRDIYAEEA